MDNNYNEISNQLAELNRVMRALVGNMEPYESPSMAIERLILELSLLRKQLMDQPIEPPNPVDVPTTPPWTAPYKPWENPWGPTLNTNRCQVCGLDMSGPMGYVCPNYNCPSQFKVTCKTTTTTEPGYQTTCGSCKVDPGIPTTLTKADRMGERGWPNLGPGAL